MNLTPKQMWAVFWRIFILAGVASMLSDFMPKWGCTIGWMAGCFGSIWYDSIIERFKDREQK